MIDPNRCAGSGWPGQSGSATRPPSTAALGSIAHVTETTDPDVSLRVLVYSSQAATRGRVISALGTRTHPDLPRLDHLEVATAAAAISHLDAGGIELAILDGARVAVEHEHPRGVAAFGRPLGDQAVRQVEVVGVEGTGQRDRGDGRAQPRDAVRPSPAPQFPFP